jgi:hypothetical protein
MVEYMKKYMVADLVKDLRSDKIKEYIRLYDIDPEDMGEINDLSKKYYYTDLSNIAISELDRPFQMFYLIKEYGINSDEANYLVENWDNEADWKQVMETAESLGIGIEDVEDDDVEAFSEISDMGGNQGYYVIGSDLGKGYIYYTKECGWCLLLIFADGHPANYPISKEEAMNIRYSDSLGTYYNDNMRNDDQYSDIPCAWGCIGPDPDNPKRLMTAEDKAKLPKDLQLLV